MTYIESALYDFIKTILTRGIRTLKDPRYFQYSIFLLLIVTISTITAFVGDITSLNVNNNTQDLLLYVELGAAIAFVSVGILLGRVNALIQMILIVSITVGVGAAFYFDLISNGQSIAINAAAVFYVVWIGIAAFSTFSLFRDLFENKIFGTILFLGKPEDDGKVMFSLIGWLLAILNAGMGYFVYKKGVDGGSNALTYSGLFIILFALIAMIPLLNLQGKHDVFFTIITTFYMFTTIRVILLAFRSLTETPGSTSYWDTLFSMFIALYAIQGAAVKGIKIGELDDEEEISIEEKTMQETERFALVALITKFLSDRGIILVILGTVIGFHAMQVQTIMGRDSILLNLNLTQGADIVLLGYQVNILVSLLIYVLAMVLFFIFPPFRSYANPEITRIPWAPPYDDLKLLVFSIKEGEIEWKSDALKLVAGVAMDKIKGKFGRDKSEERISSTLGRLLGRAKEKK